MVRAFLIGAGATKAEYLEAPLSNDFFGILKKTNKPLFNKINDVIHVHLGPAAAPLEDFNVEDVMELAVNFPESNRISFLGNLHSAIYELLASRTESTSEDIKGYLRGTIQRPQALLKTLLVDSRLKKDDFFITLNYDLYLDREILSINHGKIDYGIKEEHLGWIKEINLSSKPDFSVYHLHGSLNWEIVNNAIGVHLGAVRPRSSRVGSNLCLVPPGNKEFPPMLKPIWEVAENRLMEADELIIIGCSLNVKDTALIKLIKKFVNKKGAKNVKIIYKKDDLFGGSEKVNYLKIVGQEITLFPFGFFINGPDPRSGRHGAIEFIFD